MRKNQVAMRKNQNDTHGLLTVPEAAELLRVSPATIYRMVAQRTMPCLRIGRNWRFRLADLEAWTRTLSFQPSGKAHTRSRRKSVAKQRAERTSGKRNA